jgi:hypothetical protein
LKLLQEWEDREIKENSGGDEFSYDMFDTL